VFFPIDKIMVVGYNGACSKVGGAVSLRKSPTLTAALIASNRRNAKKSTGPRTAQRKAWSRLNSLRDGWHSPEYISLVKALLDAPPGRVGVTAQALLSSKPALHPLFREIAEISVQAEIDICNESRRQHARRERKKNSFFPTSEAGMLLKTNNGENDGFSR
jgi:hypothetical protein